MNKEINRINININPNKEYYITLDKRSHLYIGAINNNKIQILRRLSLENNYKQTLCNYCPYRQYSKKYLILLTEEIINFLTKEVSEFIYELLNQDFIDLETISITKNNEYIEHDFNKKFIIIYKNNRIYICSIKLKQNRT